MKISFAFYCTRGNFMVFYTFFQDRVLDLFNPLRWQLVHGP